MVSVHLHLIALGIVVECAQQSEDLRGDTKKKKMNSTYREKLKK